ncbi:MAG: hypothetical protein FLDDKLPJ_03444 [Phycisphaerae bacterium]|nr:hypothetical protein [Phycisphaerae bacterium]
MSASQFKSAGSDAVVEVRVEAAAGGREGAFRVHVSDRTIELEVRRRGPSEGFLHVQGRVLPYYAVRRAGEVEVWIDGRRHVIERALPAARRGAAAAGMQAVEVKAPMPGTILKILVKSGDAVAAHQPLIVMESMKMEMTLSASGAGRVGEVRCREGELVAMNTVLVRFVEEAAEGS